MEIIMVHSYKGGSGKTLLCYNFASVLSSRGNKVLLVEGDLDGPVFHNNFPNLKPKRYLNQYLKQPGDLESYIVKHDPFDMVFASPDFTMHDRMSNQDFEYLLEKIIDIRAEIKSLDYDCVLIDLSPGVNYLAVASIVLANRVILTLRPDQNSFEGTKLLINRIYANTVRNNDKQFHMVINQVPDLLGFAEIVNEWEIVMKYEFSFLSSFHIVPFSPLTNLSVLRKQVILGKDDPIFVHLNNITDKLTILDNN